METSLLNYPKKRDLAKIGNDIYQRLFLHEQLVSNNYNINVDDARSNPQKKSNAGDLKDIPFKTVAFQGNEIQENSSAHIKKEMPFCEATKECPKVLRKLKFCLDCIPPSSVKSERCFSAAELFIWRLKSSLSDEMIDSLCLVRSFLEKGCYSLTMWFNNCSDFDVLACFQVYISIFLIYLSYFSNLLEITHYSNTKFLFTWTQPYSQQWFLQINNRRVLRPFQKVCGRGTANNNPWTICRIISFYWLSANVVIIIIIMRGVDGTFWLQGLVVPGPCNKNL